MAEQFVDFPVYATSHFLCRLRGIVTMIPMLRAFSPGGHELRLPILLGLL